MAGRRKRTTPVTGALPAPVTAPFYANAERLTQWRAHVARIGLTGAPTDFQVVGELLTRFRQPVWGRLLDDGEITGASWPPGGPWSAAGGTP